MNVISAVFSTLFSLLNSLLITLTFETNLYKFGIGGSLLFTNMFVLTWTNFSFLKMSYTAWMALSISSVYFLILIPFYGYVIMSILNDQLKETLQSISQKDFYLKMFDSMQQGICTIDNGKIIFMNDLCNKFTSELSGLLDFE